MLLQSDDLPGAQRILTAILTKYPDNADAVLGLATVFERQDDKAGAKRVLEEGLATSPDSSVLLFKGGHPWPSRKRITAAAEKYYLKLLQTTDKKTPVQLMIVRLYEQSGQVDKAEAMMNEQIKAEPENLEYRLALAGFHLRHKQYDKSMAVIDTAEKDGLKDIKLDLGRVDILIIEKKLDEAIALLPGIAERYPDHPLSAMAMSKLGSLYLSKKDYPAALAALDDAAERNPSPETLFLRGQARLGTGDVEGAIADLQIVRKEMPENYQARYPAGPRLFCPGQGADGRGGAARHPGAQCGLRALAQPAGPLLLALRPVGCGGRGAGRPAQEEPRGSVPAHRPG